MLTSALFCLATSRGRADRIVNELKSAGFLPTEIGVLFLDRNIPSDPGREREVDAGMSPAAARSAGPIRGVLGWVAGIGRRRVPGVGAFIAAGPITPMLHEAHTSSPGVAIAAGLIALGIPASDATRLEQRIKFDGHFLISVHTNDSARIAQTRGIFETSFGEAICTTAETLTTPA